MLSLSFKKRPRNEITAAESDLRARLIEATIAAVEGQWTTVEERIQTAALLTKHIRQAQHRNS